MSKIFEALNRSKGDISETTLAQLGEIPPVEAAPPPPENPLPPAEPPLLAAPAEPIAAFQPVAEPVPSPSSVAAPIAMRTLPLQISSATPLLPFDGNHEEASEQYRMIRTRLIHHPKQPQLIVIASAVTGDGKTVTAVNLAGALSLKTEAKVLIMDADFRRSALHRQLGLPKEPGLAEVLSGLCTLEEALIHTEQLPNLYVLPSGDPKANPAELLDTPRWPALAAHLRQMFRHVIVDSPAVASVTDYELIQAVCDGVVLVVRPDHTHRKTCLAALEIIPKNKLIGAIVNCVPDWFLGRYASPFEFDDYQSKNGA